MKKLLVACLWSASTFSAVASTDPQESPQLLKEEDVRNPKFVAHWLAGAGSKADQKDARWFFSRGLKEKEVKNWSAASKAFGESMKRYPSPHALFEYADSDLQMLGQVRAREGFPAKVVREDMVYALGFYEAAIAANEVTRSLSKQEVLRVAGHASCLKKFLESSNRPRDCQPVDYFKSGRVPK